MTAKTLVYLATPYSDPDPAVRLARFEEVNRTAARLMAQGLHVYSPISHMPLDWDSHPIALAGDLWEQYDRAILQACKRVIVLCQAGWERSKGVAAEMRMAEELGLPVQFLTPPRTE
jgi:hypothetical protein